MLYVVADKLIIHMYSIIVTGSVRCVRGGAGAPVIVPF